MSAAKQRSILRFPVAQIRRRYQNPRWPGL